jgi:hypothetical protein
LVKQVGCGVIFRFLSWVVTRLFYLVRIASRSITSSQLLLTSEMMVSGRKFLAWEMETVPFMTEVWPYGTVADLRETQRKGVCSILTLYIDHVA